MDRGSGPDLFRPMISAPMPAPRCWQRRRPRRAGLVPPHDLRADARPPLLAKASSTPVPPPGWPCTAQKVRVPKNHCGSRSPACPKGAPGLAPHQRRIHPATRRSYGRAPATWRSPHSDALEHNPGQGAQHPHPAPVRTIRRARTHRHAGYGGARCPASATPPPVRTIRRARTHRHAGYGTEPALAARAGRAQEPIRLIWSASRPSAGLRPEQPNEASCAARTIGPRPTLPMSALPAPHV